MTSSGAPIDKLSATIADHLQTVAQDRLPDGCLPLISESLAIEHLRLAPAQARVIDPSLNETGTIYAIHNADLKLMDESTAIAGALWTLTNSPLAVLGKLVALLYRLRRKRGRLEGETALALLVLKEAPNGGWTVAEVRDHLGSAFGVLLPEDRVLGMLNGLKDFRLSDNTLTDFADEHQGRWFAVDV
jgi:hypothetical protein